MQSANRVFDRSWRRLLAAAACGAVIFPMACARGGGSDSPQPIAKPVYARASQALDPALEANWPENWRSSKHADHLFASFVRHAQMSSDWLLLTWRGEAVFVRADRERMEIEFQADSNKITRLAVNGPCETLSLRMYVPAQRLEFDLEASKLEMWKAQGRSNPAFSGGDPTQTDK